MTDAAPAVAAVRNVVDKVVDNGWDGGVISPYDAVFERSRALQGRLEELVAADDRVGVQMLLDCARQRTELLVAARDLLGLIRWCALADRAADNFDRGETELGLIAAARLDAELRAMDRLAAGLSNAKRVAEENELARGVRGRVLQLVRDRPGVRPREMVDELNLHPSQVSRAVRELVEAQCVTAVQPDAGDGRAVTYWPAAIAVA